jgi:predicted permease
VVLGGQLEMKEIRGFRIELIAAIVMRLIVAPAIGFGLILAAVRMGYLEAGPVEMAVLIAVFGSPAAVSSIVMSSEMGGDGHLAGQIVVWTSILGMVSLFFIVFFMRLGGLL